MKHHIVKIITILALHNIFCSVAYPQSDEKKFKYIESEGLVSLDGNELKVVEVYPGSYFLWFDDIAQFCKKLSNNDFGYLLLPTKEYKGKKIIELTVLADYLDIGLDENIYSAQVTSARALLQKYVNFDDEASIDYNKSIKMYCIKDKNIEDMTHKVCSNLSTRKIYQYYNSEPTLVYDDNYSKDINVKISDSKSAITEILGLQNDSNIKVTFLNLVDGKNIKFEIQYIVNDDLFGNWNIVYDPDTSKIIDYGLYGDSTTQNVIYYTMFRNIEKRSYENIILSANLLLKCGELNAKIYNKSEIYKTIGYAYHDIGNYNQAALNIVKYLNSNKNDYTNLIILSEIYVKLNKYKEALIYASKAISVSRGKQEAVMLRAKIYLQTGKNDLAKNDFRRACNAGNNEACNYLLK